MSAASTWRKSMNFPLTRKTALLLVILLSVLLNLSAFLVAYPQTFQPQAPNLERDFSAYYLGAWRLIHNPSQIYHVGVLPGDFQSYPSPQFFKYAPSFLLLILPFLSLNYSNALHAFDIVQLLSILALAFFVYKLMENKNLFLATVVSIVVIIDPILFSNSISYNSLGFMQSRIYNLHPQTFSPMYFCGYWLVNAHVLQTVLLVGALYFGFAKKPWVSALLFAFGVFDPRSALFAVPLLLWFNRHSVWKFLGGIVVFLGVTNLPFFFIMVLVSCFCRLKLMVP